MTPPSLRLGRAGLGSRTLERKQLSDAGSRGCSSPLCKSQGQGHRHARHEPPCLAMAQGRTGVAAECQRRNASNAFLLHRTESVRSGINIKVPLSFTPLAVRCPKAARCLDGRLHRTSQCRRAARGRRRCGENPKDPKWYLGERHRHRGSLHQDVCVGTAADLASRGFIAVYPAARWWRTRPKQERYDLPARYSLVVSIRTQQTEVDLYTAIEQRILVEQQVVIET